MFMKKWGPNSYILPLPSGSLSKCGELKPRGLIEAFAYVHLLLYRKHKHFFIEIS